MKTILPISILIPTMNRPNTLMSTINSYMDGSVLPSQIVVVDQSKEENVQNENKKILEKYSRFTSLTYVYQDTASLTKARNNALNYATEEIIVFSDDDIYAYENTLKNVFDHMSNKNISMIAGIDDNSLKSSSIIGYLLGTKSYKKRHIGHVTTSVLGRYPNRIEREVKTEWAMGYFFVVRKSLIEKWRIKWDEKLLSYAYAEDLDFSYSYYKFSTSEGYKCIITENVRVKHMVSTEYRIPSCKTTYMYILHRSYIANKHKMGIKSQIACFWCNFWRLVQRSIKQENAKDMLNAMLYLLNNRESVYSGHFYYGE